MPAHPPRRLYIGALPPVRLVIAGSAFDTVTRGLEAAGQLSAITAPAPREAVALAMQAQADALALALPSPRSLLWSALEALRDSGVGIAFAADMPPDEAKALCDAGYGGVISPQAPVREAASALEAIGRGQQVIAPANQPCELSGRPRHMFLSEREAVILALICEGYSTARIAQQVYIAESTVKAHVSALMRRFGAANRVALAVAAVRAGLLDGKREAESVWAQAAVAGGGGAGRVALGAGVGRGVE